jgi:predicted transposase YdaD
MRRDAIFYQIFVRFPGLLFEFVEHPPAEAQCYGRRQKAESRRQSFVYQGFDLYSVS